MRSLSHIIGRLPASLVNNVAKRTHAFFVDCLFQGCTASIAAMPPQSSAPLRSHSMTGYSCLMQAAR